MKLNEFKKNIKSVRVKLFFTISLVIATIIVLLIIINNVVLGKFYLYHKTKTMKNVYNEINREFSSKEFSYQDVKESLKTLSVKNNIDILIQDEYEVIILITDNYEFDRSKYYDEGVEESNDEFNYSVEKSNNDFQQLYKQKELDIRLIKDENTDVSYILVIGELENGFSLTMKTPTADLQESARISNNVLIAIGSAIIIISGIIASVISRRFTAPILELNGIAQKMSNLDFSQKYRISDADDEINNLGKSINLMSDKLENTINMLKTNNSELEKDIERKSKIDEMRKKFISDVSHELKTPIALIQGYAEGLVENVNADDESREFYANVILDEANKMDRLVKQLLELMKLEYGKRQFTNENFDIVELIKEVIRKSNVMLEENNVKIKFACNAPIIANADAFYIEQIITNYITNAIKYSKEIQGERYIEITVLLDNKNKKIRVNVFNTGDNIDESEFEKIWGRFYKIDSSRNREKGGTGIGLAFVKAIMNNYKNKYGVVNKKNGVEFYFELDMDK